MKRLSLILVLALLAPLVAAEDVVDRKEVTFKAADGLTVWGDVYASAKGKAAPLILLFHQGGGDARGEYGPIIPRLLREGFNVLAVDLRQGGNKFGGTNRTIAPLKKEATYCEAYPDLEAALAWAVKEGFSGPRIAWGSSFSAMLVLRLAVEHPREIQAVLAFSPASGEAMGACQPHEYVRQLGVPTLSLRPAAEMEIERVARLQELFAEAGHQTFVSTPGVHGSSMLVESRVNANVDETWSTVLSFLERATKHD